MGTDPLAARLAAALEEKEGAEALCRQLGFPDPRKSAVNLGLLRPVLEDDRLLAAVAEAALETADSDQALNSLERLAGTVTGGELRQVLADEETRRPLLTLLGASPFLAGILCRDPHYFRDLLLHGEYRTAKSEAEMLAELRRAAVDGCDFAALQRELRCYKRREILRIGCRDLCGLADLQAVTGELSALAAASLQRAYEICTSLLQAEYGRPLLEAGEGEEPEEAEFTILGMGKFGGRELNFSSDIDLIYFYSSDRGRTEGISGPTGEPVDRLHLHQYFVKLAEMITKAIGQATEDGFVFRVDLDLRPEGKRGEMANSLRGAEIYYESWGQSWERSAMIKARPVAGSLSLGERLLRNLEPFIYRRYLDYGMIEDIKGMKLRIDRSLAREREGETNLKLGRGGIREIEFFVQALQLIYAGKNPELRERGTLKALEQLRDAGLVKPEEHRSLAEAYVFLRTVEHRIQVEQERQTHNLPSRPEELRVLARRCGFADAASFRAALEDHRGQVTAIYRDLFFTGEEEVREEVRPEIAFLFDPAADADLVKDLLAEKGFQNPDTAYDGLAWLRDGPPHAHLTQRARRHLERIAPLLLQEVIDSPEPDMALVNLERFLGAVRARATHYALLAENPGIIKMLVSLFGTSQFLSRIFIQHPEILDSLVSRGYAVPFKDRETLRRDLLALLETAPGYEEQLDAIRRFRNEEFLRIALHDIRGETGQGEGTAQLSFLAEVCLEQAWSLAREELLPRFGLPGIRGEDGSRREAGFAVVGMGKLGGMELNYHSDLDIIFIYEGEGENRPAEGTDPERFRSLTNQEYFARLAQRIISVLTLMTREGFVYQIDTRLRPSGNQGPLVTSLAAFRKYHGSSAQLWERQALTKARVVVGPRPLAGQIEKVRQEIVYGEPVPAELAGEICRLRGRMESELAKEEADRFNIKTGRGGMVDVEFVVQYLQLLHGRGNPEVRSSNTLKALEALERSGLVEPEAAEVLGQGYRFLRRLENKLRLVHDQSINELSGDRRFLLKLARRLGYPEKPRRPEAVLLEDYRRITGKIRRVFEEILGCSPEERS